MNRQNKVSTAFHAQYAGKCPVCNSPIGIGDLVHYQKDSGGIKHLTHERCIFASKTLAPDEKKGVTGLESPDYYGKAPWHGKKKDELLEYEQGLVKYFKEWFDFASFMMDQIDETRQRLRKLMSLTPRALT